MTITEQYFSGTTEDIPAGINVHELASSTDTGNKGLNQNYFTQGAVGTQTGPVSFGQPTVFTSPSSGATATQHFTVTTSVTETYVLGNSYMGSPSTVTISAPRAAARRRRAVRAARRSSTAPACRPRAAPPARP